MVKHKSKTKKTVDKAKVIMLMIQANIMAYVVTSIFILLGSIILTYTNASASVEHWIVIIGIILSAFLAGFDTAKVDTRNGYKWGAMGGVLYFIVFLLMGTILREFKGISLSSILTLALAILMSSSIAGMISVNYGK